MTKQERIEKIAEINNSNLTPQAKVLSIKEFVKQEQEAEKESEVEKTKQEERASVKKVEITNIDDLKINISNPEFNIPQIDLKSTNELLQQLVDKKQDDISITLKIV